jgi:hypothetical protein
MLLFDVVHVGSGMYGRIFWGRNLFIIVFFFSEEVVVSQKHQNINLNMLFTVSGNWAVFYYLLD